MKEDDKLINAVIDLGTGMKDLRGEIKGMRKDMNHQLGELNHRVENIEKQQEKTNLAIGELRLSYMKGADGTSKLRSEFSGMRSDFNKYATANNTRANGYEKRITKLEQ